MTMYRTLLTLLLLLTATAAQALVESSENGDIRAYEMPTPEKGKPTSAVLGPRTDTSGRRRACRAPPPTLPPEQVRN